jgi:hypothetical protein
MGRTKKWRLVSHFFVLPTLWRHTVYLLYINWTDNGNILSICLITCKCTTLHCTLGIPHTSCYWHRCQMCVIKLAFIKVLKMWHNNMAWIGMAEYGDSTEAGQLGPLTSSAHTILAQLLTTVWHINRKANILQKIAPNQYSHLQLHWAYRWVMFENIQFDLI